MARDHARINLAIWNDDDFLDLPPLAQHLYFILWTHPDLSYAGVVDWRPPRLAERAAGWSAEDVILAGKCLEARLFLIVDEHTEECLVRSWVRWDGLMKQPIMAVSFAKARAAVASREIRAVIVHEARKLKKLEPDLPGWGRPQVRELLAQAALDPRERHLPTDPLTPGLTPAVTPGLTLRAGVGVNPSPNPSPTPSPSPSPTTTTSHGTTANGQADAPADADARPAKSKSRGTRIPEPFTVTPEMVEWARRECPGLNHKAITERFVDYWRGVAGHNGVKLDWPATWRNWMRREAEGGNTGRSPTERPRAGSNVWTQVVGGEPQ